MSANSSARVSIGLPVYNGEDFLAEAIESILTQTFEDFELIISDNASTDSTEAICRAYVTQDKRVRYYRNQENIGASGNYTRVFELSSCEYFKWAAHDDVCGPDFLLKCVEVLDQDPSVVLCYTRTTSIDANGKCIKEWDSRAELGSAAPHRRFQESLAQKESFPVWGLIRTNILRKTPLLGNYPAHDLALLAELSLYGRFYEIPEFLFFMREHKKRSVRTYDFRNPHEAIIWYDPKMAGRLIFPAWRLFAEHVAGINRAPLSLRDRMPCYIEMARWLKKHRQELVRDIMIAGTRLPGIGALLARAYERYLESRWLKKTNMTAKDIDLTIPAKDMFILADDAKLPSRVFARWRTMPFLEQGGRYWGPPSDDDTAIRELERSRQLGANFFVLSWPAFWWCDYYSRFYGYLRAKYRRVLENDRVVVFDLRQRIEMEGNS